LDPLWLDMLTEICINLIVTIDLWRLL